MDKEMTDSTSNVDEWIEALENDRIISEKDFRTLS